MSNPLEAIKDWVTGLNDHLKADMEAFIHEREIGAKQWVLLRVIRHAYDDIADAEMDRVKPDQAKVAAWRAAADSMK